MTLEEFVLTYREDGSDKPLVSIEGYYEEYIKPLDPRFKDCSFQTHRTVICCFKDHQDINPSLGTVPHRSYRGVRKYHCFGCGAVGDVITLHQRIEREYHNRRLSRKEAALDLCKLYGINAVQFENTKDDDDQSGYLRRYNKTLDLRGIYSKRDFATDLMLVREHPEASLDERVNAITTALIKETATYKGLVD